MKRLFLSAIFAVVAFTSNAQVFNFQTFQYQDIVIKNEDTTYSEPMLFVATYIFDITNNTITADINGVVTTLSVFCWIDTESGGNQYAGLTYNDFPLNGWLINITTKEVLYNELRINQSDLLLKFPNAILTKL